MITRKALGPMANPTWRPREAQAPRGAHRAAPPSLERHEPLNLLTACESDP